MTDQEKINAQCLRKDPEERTEALERAKKDVIVLFDDEYNNKSFDAWWLEHYSKVLSPQTHLYELLISRPNQLRSTNDQSIHDIPEKTKRYKFSLMSDKLQDYTDLLDQLDHFKNKYSDSEIQLIESLTKKRVFNNNHWKIIDITDATTDASSLYLPEKLKEVPDSQITHRKEIISDNDRVVENWEISDKEQENKAIEDLLSVLEIKIPQTPENRDILNSIKEMKSEKDIIKQYEILSTIVSLIPTVKIKEEASVKEKKPIPLTIPLQIEERSLSKHTNAYLIAFIAVSFTLYNLLLRLKMINGSTEWTYLAIIFSILFFIFQILKREGYNE